MNFFQQQAKAKSMTRRLVWLFLFAVLAIITAMVVLVLILFGQPSDSLAGASLLSVQNLNDQSGLLAITGIGAASLMGFSSLIRMAGLRGGGGKVAQELGGQRVDPDTRDPLQRRLVNVVEEIALASGVPVPEIYVLDHESGINAFAAGYSPSDAAVAVTRGTLETLNRSELQGVIAHEFSHILNGDMRLNIKLIGLLFGILVMAILGRKLLHNAYLFGSSRRSNNNGTLAILAIAVGMVAIGYIGLFFGRWIKAAVSRQREYLADASAVQFTRDPGGIAGALKKIAASQSGALLETESEEYSHMLFGPGGRAKMFATHPPLVERIQAIEPGFRAEEIADLAKRMARERRQALDDAKREAGRQANKAKPGAAGNMPGGFDFSADSIIDNIGHPGWQTILAAAALAETLPDALVRAARHHEWAPALVLLLLLDEDNSIREQQLADINEHVGEMAGQQVNELLRQFNDVASEQRLPLLEIALPAVKRRSRAEIRQLHTAIRALSMADQKISPFEFLLIQITQNYLQDALQPASVKAFGNKKLEHRRAPIITVLSVLAWFGHSKNNQQARPAFDAAFSALEIPPAKAEPRWPTANSWVPDLERALKSLNELNPLAKEKLVKSWLACVMHDATATVHELEMLRAFCATVHVPMPPLTSDT